MVTDTSVAPDDMRFGDETAPSRFRTTDAVSKATSARTVARTGCRRR